jgi:lysophospholipase L1-like esterase
MPNQRLCRRLLFLVVLALVPRAAHARIILNYGDSITQIADLFDITISYPAQLQALRPDDIVINGGQCGDTSFNSARLRQAIETHHPDELTLLIGLNDFKDWSQNTPKVTFRNIVKMAKLARAMDVPLVHVLTLSPVICDDPITCARARSHVRAVNALLLSKLEFRRSRGLPWLTINDLNDYLHAYAWSDVSFDGLHLNRYGAAVVADYLNREVLQ